MTEPIPFVVTRFRCPHCPRTGSGKKQVRDHIGRCWLNPAARGCKTCKHFIPVSAECCGQPDLHQCYTPMCPQLDACGLDVDLSGNDFDIKPGPIVGCEKWEATAAPTPEGAA